MKSDQIRDMLFRLQDRTYREFQVKLIPNVPPESVIGVRTPALRALAKELRQADVSGFLRSLPHRYFDENQLHAFLISDIRDYDRCAEEVDRFLPYVDNWATCDQMSPAVFRKHPTELLERIRSWLQSDQPYTVRFGVGMLMQHYLDGRFDPSYPELVAALRSEEYYVNMMIAWYFATALAKQYEQVLPYLEKRRLDAWTHNKAIQKALESRRITPEQKAYLRSLKVGKDAPRASGDRHTSGSIELRRIDDQNRAACELLSVKDAQRQYIADNARSLAAAKEHADVARPFAIYADGRMVGFAMLAFDEANEDPDDRYWLWRFMIDQKEQGKGFGRAALAEIIRYFRAHGADTITLSTKPSNTAALALYHAFGFAENGQMNGEEQILKLRL